MEVFAFGNGKSNGELGSGKYEQKTSPCEVDFNFPEIRKIAANESNVIVLTQSGDVYVWGRNHEGELGNNTKSINSSVPVRVTGELVYEKIVNVSVGSYHVTAISSQGRVYQWGKLYRMESIEIDKIDYRKVQMTGLINNDASAEQKDNLKSVTSVSEIIDDSNYQYYSNGQKNIPVNQKKTFGKFHSFIQRTPLLVESLYYSGVKIVKSAAGYGFTIFVSDRGDVYSWGINDKFQLGLGHRFNQVLPQKIPNLKDISDIACGLQHCLALDKHGRVYSWGLGTFGQLGNHSLSSLSQPCEVYSIPKCTKIACGSYHSLALSVDGIIWSWGSSEYAQHGGSREMFEMSLDSKVGKEYFYRSIPLENENVFGNDKCIDIKCGYLHNIALTKSGRVWTWGWGQTGALGHDNTFFQVFPKLIRFFEGEVIKEIAASARCSYVVKEKNFFSLAFAEAIGSNFDSDMYFSSQDGYVVPAHQALIIKRCPRLNSLYLLTQRFCIGTPTEYNGKLLLIIPLDAQTLKFFLYYLYTDNFKTTFNCVKKLGNFARFVGLNRLRALCNKYLSVQLSTTFFSAVPESEWERQIGELVNSPQYSTMKLKLDDESIFYAHKVILYYRSKYWKKALDGTYNESSLEEVSLSNVDCDNLRYLMFYWYTNKIPNLTEDNILGILKISDAFLELSLKSYLEDRIIEDLALENVFYTLELSDINSLRKARTACVLMIIENFNTLKPFEYDWKEFFPTVYAEVIEYFKKKDEYEKSLIEESTF